MKRTPKPQYGLPVPTLSTTLLVVLAAFVPFVWLFLLQDQLPVDWYLAQEIYLSDQTSGAPSGILTRLANYPPGIVISAAVVQALDSVLGLVGIGAHDLLRWLTIFLASLAVFRLNTRLDLGNGQQTLRNASSFIFLLGVGASILVLGGVAQTMAFLFAIPLARRTLSYADRAALGTVELATVTGLAFAASFMGGIGATFCVVGIGLTFLLSGINRPDRKWVTLACLLGAGFAVLTTYLLNQQSAMTAGFSIWDRSEAWLFTAYPMIGIGTLYLLALRQFDAEHGIEHPFILLFAVTLAGVTLAPTAMNIAAFSVFFTAFTIIVIHHFIAAIEQHLSDFWMHSLLVIALTIWPLLLVLSPLNDRVLAIDLQTGIFWALFVMIGPVFALITVFGRISVLFFRVGLLVLVMIGCGAFFQLYLASLKRSFPGPALAAVQMLRQSCLGDQAGEVLVSDRFDPAVYVVMGQDAFVRRYDRSPREFGPNTLIFALPTEWHQIPEAIRLGTIMAGRHGLPFDMALVNVTPQTRAACDHD